MKERNFVHTASDCTCYAIGRADRPEKVQDILCFMFTRMGNENRLIGYGRRSIAREETLGKALCIIATFLFLYILIFNASLSHQQ